MTRAEARSAHPHPVVPVGEQVESVSPSSSSKFCITWLADPAHSQRVRAPPDQLAPLLSAVTSGEEEWSSDHDPTLTMNGDPDTAAGPAHSTDAAYTGELGPSNTTTTGPSGTLRYPALARATSMPLPSQLHHLQNPHRTPGRPSGLSNNAHHPPESVESDHLRELSLELADAVQTVVQTMLQIAPSQLLDPAKEQFSACSLSVPTPSMSAMFTTMKTLNYISANMSRFCSTTNPPPPLLETSGPLEGEGLSSHDSPSDFDVGEMLQSVGDALSGAAAQAGVDVVLFHGDVGLKHVYARGNESGLSYALSHVIRQVLCTAQKGDTIEIGLFINPVSHRGDEPESSQARGKSPSFALHEDLRCTFEVAHKFFVPDSTGKGTNGDQMDQSLRKSPNLSSLLLRRLLHLTGASLEGDLPPKRFQYGRTCELGVTLEAGSPQSLNGSEASDNGTSTEPTLEELQQFAETLRGNKVTLHASVKGSFAHHLTSYLTAWGLDVSHVSSDYEEGTVDDLSPIGVNEGMSRSDPNISISSAQPRFSSSVAPPHQSAQDIPSALFQSSFVIIDDDLNALRQRLQEVRSDPYLPPNTSAPRKRPSLSAHHRPRSSPHVVRAMGHPPPPLPSAPIVLLHFTSLSNYKNVKQTIQSAVANFSSTSTPIPEILIIPKPAGPRRFLTALHTAATRPIVDPFFIPIATSPMSPGLHSHSFFSSYQGTTSPRSPDSRPVGTRSNSDMSSRSDYPSTSSQVLPSPLAMPDNMEYFSDHSAKLGSSPSSGFVIQSPNGQPAGIFFHPRPKHRAATGSTPMERDRPLSNTTGSTERRPTASRSGTSPRLPSSRRPSDSLQTVPFAALHTEQTAASRFPSSQFITPSSIGLGLEIGDQHGSASPARRPTLNIEDRPQSSSSNVLPTGNPIITRKVSDPPPKSPLKETPVPPQPKRGDTRLPAPEAKSPKTVASPIAPTPKPPPPAKKSKANDGNVIPPISVLVVDDNPINQTILTTFMKKKKIKYDVAMNGQEAVQKWRTGGFHLILMDIQMPVMDGIQATKEIRRMERANAQAGYPPSPMVEDRPSPCPTPSEASGDPRGSPYRSSVIIVALTASSLQSDRVAALAAGCNDFLTKPVSLLWLNNKIIEWGSIKALQMWADLRPDVAKTIASGQEAKAQDVADRLHVPKGRRTPSPTNRSPGQSAIALSNAGNPNAPRALNRSVSMAANDNFSTGTVDSPLSPASPHHPIENGTSQAEKQPPEKSNAAASSGTDGSSNGPNPGDSR